MKRIRTSTFIAATLAAMVLLLSGCGGGGSSPQVANLGSGTTTTGTTGAGSSSSGAEGLPPPRANGRGQLTLAGGGAHMMQFAACMRSHGVPNFPDPNAQGVISMNSSSGLDPGSPQFQQAQRSCAKDLPNGGTPSPAQQAQMRQQALAFSACMRSHGLSKFPDPQFSTGGHVTMSIGADSGIDPRSPQFQAAQTACQGLLPGRTASGSPGAVGVKSGEASTGSIGGGK